MDKRHERCPILLGVLRVSAVLLTVALSAVFAQSPNQASKGPWLDKSLSPDKRADLLIEKMTLDEKLVFVHGNAGSLARLRSLGGAGFVPGIPRLGIPDLQMTDGRSGVANTGWRGRYATALPSSLADAASWDPKVAYEYGALIGKESRDIGFNVSLGGTSNIIREPRNGRNFECLGEDPILVGKMLGAELKGTQDQQVIGDINRYAVNDQETGRMFGNSVIDRRAMQETDLLAFEIAIKESNVGTVMCAYNHLNDVYSCENSYLLIDVLKKAWDYKGWVMTDWGAAHSTVKSALAGLDQEMGQAVYFGSALEQAVEKGEVPVARINDMVHRILRTEFALGVFDNPPVPRPVNPFTGAEVAQRVEEQGIVLLKNASGQLPARGVGHQIDCHHRLARGCGCAFRRRLRPSRCGRRKRGSGKSRCGVAPLVAAESHSRRSAKRPGGVRLWEQTSPQRRSWPRHPRSRSCSSINTRVKVTTWRIYPCPTTRTNWSGR